MGTTGNKRRHDADVVIVGGGPVGTALAIELAMADVRVIVLESRDADERPHPGTNLTNMRSMEHVRRWGATEHIKAANTIGDAFARDAQFPTRGTGHMMAKIAGAYSDAEPLPFSSASPHFGPQATVERGLRRRLAELPSAEIRFRCSVLGFEEHDGQVTSTARSAGGAQERITSAFLVGADGSSSPVRKQLGVRLDGGARLAQGTAWYVRSPAIRDLLAEHLGLAVFTWFTNEDRNGVLLIAQDDDGVFQYMSVPLEEGADGGDWDAMRERLVRAVGAELPVEPLEGGTFWINSLVAPTFHRGRVFLAGDAAHHISVVGGFGMNTGIADAADLGWKLTAAIRGWAGPGLLDSYDEERIPVDGWIRDLTEEATKHLGQYSQPGMEDPGPDGDALRARIGEQILHEKRQEVVSLGAQFGAAYLDSPVIVSDGTRPPAATFGEFTASASPGARAPHVWLDTSHSLFDEIAHEGFTLLCLTPTADPGPLEEAACMRGVPLRVVMPRDETLPASYEATMALVRPDHYVAWRGSEPPADPLAVIDTVRGAGQSATDGATERGLERSSVNGDGAALAAAQAPPR